MGNDGTLDKHLSLEAARILLRSASHTPCPTCLPFSP